MNNTLKCPHYRIVPNEIKWSDLKVIIGHRDKCTLNNCDCYCLGEVLSCSFKELFHRKEDS